MSRSALLTDPANPAADAALACELRAALIADQLALRYQPIFDIRKSEPELLAAEALVRWEHPARGVLMPAQFLPLATRHGLMPSITDYVFRQAVRQLKAWGALGIETRLAVNIAGHLLDDRSFPQRLLDQLAQYRVEPSRLILELSEQGAMTSAPDAREIIHELIGAGFPLVIDDFGQGSISLGPLMRLNFVGLKVDQCLITQIATDERAKRMVRGIVHLAHDMNMRVCAEGVETRETLYLLKGLGCDSAQGWLFGDPVRAGELPVGAAPEAAAGD